VAVLYEKSKSIKAWFIRFYNTKMESIYGFKKYFDALCGCNIYSVLPNVVENSYRNLE